MNKLKQYVKKSEPKVEKAWSLPYYHEIFSMFFNEEAVIQFCFDKGIFNVPKNALNVIMLLWNIDKNVKHTNILRKIAEKKFLSAKEYFLRKVKFLLNYYLK